MKEQDQNPQEQLNEWRQASYLKKEFRVMIVKMSQDLRQTMQKMQEMFTINLEELKRNRNE